MDINDIIIHLGEERSHYFNAVAPPVIQSSNFAFTDVHSFRSAIKDELNHHIYTRGNNPTVEILRKKIAALEDTEDALIVGSGAAAIAASVLANINAGDHIICVQKPYSWTYKLLTSFLTRFNVTHSFVDATDISNIEKAIQHNTRIIFLESPNSITFELQNLKECARLAKKHQITTIIDNSHASPVFQKPAQSGIDIVVHSATKYINGHSDVVAGVICSTVPMIQKIFNSEIMTLGMTISPHDAALMIRGIRTLPLRVRQSDASAAVIARYLHDHPKVERIYFPFHPSFEQYELAKQQMTGCGGLLSVRFRAESKEQMLKFISKLNKFMIAVSWGGYESLMMPSIAFHDIEGLPDSPIPWNHIRFYIGLESPEYLIADLEEAMKSL
jgi:cystathionine beta-lyase/cystathionine gamma-synthase